MKKQVLMALTVSAFAMNAIGSETQIPRSMADKGKYYLMEKAQKDGITTTIHKRVGVSETGYSRTEINCKTQQYRDMGYSEEGADKIKGTQGKWTEVLIGSSKFDLVSFVCNLK